MINLLPVLLLLVAAVILQTLGRLRFSAGKSWLVSAIVALLVWISMILIRFLMPSGWVINNWLPGSQNSANIIFQFTKDSWVYGFLLVSLLVTVVFSEARYLDSGSYVNILTGSMGLTAFGLLSILAGNGLTFLLTWVLIDLAEFSLLAVIIQDGIKHQIAVTSLLMRLLGIVLLILFLVIQSSSGFLSKTTGKDYISGILIVIIAVLRMGIVPFHLPYSEEPRIRTGMGSILRFIPILSVFSFLVIFGFKNFTENQYKSLLALFTFGALFGAVSWYFSRNVLAGRPYWVFSLGCLAMVAFLRTVDGALVGLAVLCVAGGMGVFQYSPRKRKRNILIPLLMVGMLGFPYTPTAVIPQALWGGKFEIINLFLLVGMAFLIGGAIRNSHRNEMDRVQSEDWTWLFHTAGLVLIAMVPWIIEMFYLESVKIVGYWWYPVALLLLIGSGILLDLLRHREGNKFSGWYKEIRKGLDPIILNLDRFFQLNWFIRLFGAIGAFIAFVINYLVRVLEGDGGILWSFLFLVLLASVLVIRQVP